MQNPRNIGFNTAYNQHTMTQSVHVTIIILTVYSTEHFEIWIDSVLSTMVEANMIIQKYKYFNRNSFDP